MNLHLPARAQPAPVQLGQRALQAIRTVDAAVSMADPQPTDQPMVVVNDACFRLAGYPPSQELGRNWQSFELAISDALRAQASTPRRHVLIVLRSATAPTGLPATMSVRQRVGSCARLRPLLAAGAELHFPPAGGMALLVSLRTNKTAGTLAQHVLGLLQPMWPCLAGIAELPTDGGDAQALTAVATAASLRAAYGAGDGLCFADAARDARDQRTRKLFSDLDGTLAAGQFRIVFQPFVELASGELSGFEALLRWSHPTLGEVMPVSRTVIRKPGVSCCRAIRTCGRSPIRSAVARSTSS